MNKTIGVFFGSGSPEHDVSIITGQLVIVTLKKLGYAVVPVYITKAGKWLLGGDLGLLKLFTDPNTKPDNDKKYWEYVLDMEESVGKMVFRKKGFMGKSVEINIAFPAFHGSFGEDGTIQGLFEMFGLPYVGCDVPASAIAMDKALTKILLRDAGIRTTKFLWFDRQDWETDKNSILNRIKQELKWPVFVKPVHLGSSIGIGKVSAKGGSASGGKDGDFQDLEFKIEVALHYDNKILVEEGVENVLDVTCCIIGNDELTASVLQESVFNKDLLDFEDKYLTDGGIQTGTNSGGMVIPARLDEKITLAIQETAKQVYRTLGCSGIARVDFLYDKQTQMFYANEVNPMPGTLYNHLWKAYGLETEDLVRKLVDLAQDRFQKNRQITYTFESNILSQLKGSKLSGSKSK
jgi:D-alanine-D-alanine ligase